MEVLSRRKATTEIYPELQQAYDFFNEALFDAALAPCLITLDRTKKCRGYFWAFRFTNDAGELTHLIAMNPAYFASRSIEDTLSTLVHEQVHLWQEQFGKPSRRSYHNKEWGDKMESVGLMPTDTGKPGGSRVGEKVTHYVIQGGAFQEACRRLLGRQFRLSWMDRFPLAPPEPAAAVAPVAIAPGPASPIDPSDRPLRFPEGDRVGPTSAVDVGASPSLGGAVGSIVWPGGADVRVAKRASKTKYRCTGCGNQVWGKPRLAILCMPCGIGFAELGRVPEGSAGTD